MRHTQAYYSKLALTQIRQLCSLGLGHQLVIPQVLAKLHDYVPSYANAFFWFDAAGNLTNAYDERPAGLAVMSAFAARHYKTLGAAVYREDWGTLVQNGLAATDSAGIFRLPRNKLLQHEYYHEILKPLDWYHSAYMSAGDIHSLHTPRCLLVVHRSKSDKPFSQAELHKLDALQPFLTQALAFAPHTEDQQWLETSSQGTLILERSGKLLHNSQQGEMLLRLACSSSIFSSAEDATGLPAGSCHILHELYDKLMAVNHGKDNSQAPMTTVTNAWGRFVLTAAWLHATSLQASSQALVCVQIRRQEPLTINLWRNIDALKLPARQGNICLLLALGHSHAAIAEQTGVSRNTVIGHSRKLYHQLQVGNRYELLNKLATEPT